MKYENVLFELSLLDLYLEKSGMTVVLLSDGAFLKGLSKDELPLASDRLCIKAPEARAEGNCWRAQLRTSGLSLPVRTGIFGRRLDETGWRRGLW